MKKTGAQLIRFALEQVGVKYTFGIPGVHNTEIYDELNSSDSIQPVLVTHECGGSFMADAISRTSGSIGTLLVVPAAGLTHAASGIGEAGLDGIPMLVISGGIHSESGHQYQLHDMDQHALMAPLTKATFKVLSHKDVIPTVYKAFETATSNEPGPVYIEMPYNISNFQGVVDDMPAYQSSIESPHCDPEAIRQAATMLVEAKQAGFFVGWGAVDCHAELKELADILAAPVATTLQGLSSFPADHPLHTGMGMGDYAVPAATQAFKNIDCLLAVGTRFSEIPTGSYGISPPENLIHLDINSEVFNANYPAKVSLHGDARQVLPRLLEQVKALGKMKEGDALIQQIRQDKDKYRQEWFDHNSKDAVNPARFFSSLRQQLKDDAIVVADDGNHTFLTAELMPILKPRHFISPSDFNAMGYCVPATVAARLANPQKQVVGIVGDGAFMMTGVETLTATNLGLGVILFIFNDGELSQISQAQEIPYNRKTCTVIHNFKPEGIALATGADYLEINQNEELDAVIASALEKSQNNKPVIVNVKVDYSKRTRFTQGVVKTNLKRFSTKEKVRAISRALIRKVTG